MEELDEDTWIVSEDRIIKLDGIPHEYDPNSFTVNAVVNIFGQWLLGLQLLALKKAHDVSVLKEFASGTLNKMKAIVEDIKDSKGINLNKPHDFKITDAHNTPQPLPLNSQNNNSSGYL
jgi:hypothetical protein